jgi:hypothetical protein
MQAAAPAAAASQLGTKNTNIYDWKAYGVCCVRYFECDNWNRQPSLQATKQTRKALGDGCAHVAMLLLLLETNVRQHLQVINNHRVRRCVLCELRDARLK